MFTRQFVKSERPLWHLKQSNIAFISYKAIERIAKHVILKPFTDKRVNATTPVSGISLLKPTQLNQQYFHLHIAPEITDTSKDRTFRSLSSNFGTTMQQLPQSMVVAHTIAWTAMIVAFFPYDHYSHIIKEDSNLACPTSKIAIVHYKLVEE